MRLVSVNTRLVFILFYPVTPSLRRRESFFFIFYFDAPLCSALVYAWCTHVRHRSIYHPFGAVHDSTPNINLCGIETRLDTAHNADEEQVGRLVVEG